MGGPNYCSGIHPSRGGGPCVLGAGGHSCSIKGNLSRIAVTMIFNILVPCVRSCTPALPKKHCKTRRFLSWLLSQPPLSKPGSHPGHTENQGVGTNRLKFSWYGPNLVKASAAQKSHESMVPIYLKKSAQNKYIGSSLSEKIILNILVPCFCNFKVART